MDRLSSTVAWSNAGTVTSFTPDDRTTPALAKVLLIEINPFHGLLPKFCSVTSRLTKRGSETSSRPNESDTRSGASASKAITGVSMAKRGCTRPDPVRVSG